MEVVVIESEAFTRLINKVVQETISLVERSLKKQEDWVGEEEAVRILGGISGSSLQYLRKKRAFIFSQFATSDEAEKGHNFSYYVPSLYEFLWKKSKQDFIPEASGKLRINKRK